MLSGIGGEPKAFDLAQAFYFPAEEPEPAEEEESDGEAPGQLRKGLHSLRENAVARQRALDVVQGAGRALAHVEERWRGDPDVVLLATGSCAEALQFARPELLADRDFALEAVQWNWRALEFLPPAFRGDRAVVRAAVRQNVEALALASDALREDTKLVGEARAGALAGLSCCEDESLRLVGPCCGGRTTDARLRFRRVASSNRGATRHRLTVHLGSGRLGFQVVSCIWQSAVRVFPLKGGDAAHFGLVRGDLAAITAAIGGEEDGVDDYFYIDEAAGAIVSIFAELSNSVAGPSGQRPGRAPAVQRQCTGRRSAARRRAAVWYCLEKEDHSLPEGIVSLVQPPGSECYKVASTEHVKRRGARAVDTKVLVDVDLRDDCQKFIMQAETLSKRAFPNQFTTEDLTGDVHLTLLVDNFSEETLGYCLYKVRDQEHALWVEQIAVSEGLRGRGLGREMMRWAKARAEAAGCTSLRLNSRNRALGFYTQLGFAVLADATSLGCRTLELHLPPGR